MTAVDGARMCWCLSPERVSVSGPASFDFILMRSSAFNALHSHLIGFLANLFKRDPIISVRSLIQSSFALLPSPGPPRPRGLAVITHISLTNVMEK